MGRRARKKHPKVEANRLTADRADAAGPAKRHAGDGAGKRPDMTWRDHLLMLLYFGAAIEHALMVEYLYAAYSIGGDQIPKKHRKMVQGWRQSIISVAKEEMGHLLTVQNILTLLGSPINLYRRDFPYDSAYNPFPPSLEPFSIDSLSCYIYAEMPPAGTIGTEVRGKLRAKRYVGMDEARQLEIIEEVKKRVEARFHKIKPHTVGQLYDEIIKLIKNPVRIPETAFNEATYSMQASWDEWGRGYKPGPRALDAEGNVKPDPPSQVRNRKPSDRHAHVMVERVATREQAVKALKALSGQGEAPHLSDDETGEPSHFDRFVQIYEELTGLGNPGWKPAYDVPVNPTTRVDFAKPRLGDDASSKAATGAPKKLPRYTVIEAKCARYFAELFNQRYRILLTYLAQSFQLARVHQINQPSLRSMVMHRVFGEMYNLKTIAGLLVRLPLKDDGESGCAAPPFEMPYTLILPEDDKDVWRRHLDLLEGVKSTCDKALKDKGSRVKHQLRACGGDDYLEDSAGPRRPGPGMDRGRPQGAGLKERAER